MDIFQDVNELTKNYEDLVSNIIINPSNTDIVLDFNSLIRTIGETAKESAISQKQFGSSNGLLINAMVKSLTNEKLFDVFGTAKESAVSSILGVLSVLCRRQLEKETASQPNIDIIAAHIETIIQVMGEHIEYRDTAFNCCRLIMVLASDSSERQYLLAKHGATTAVVKAMNRHAADPGVAEYSCRAARNLSIDDDITAKLVEDGINSIIANISCYLLFV